MDHFQSLINNSQFRCIIKEILDFTNKKTIPANKNQLTTWALNMLHDPECFVQQKESLRAIFLKEYGSEGITVLISNHIENESALCTITKLILEKDMQWLTMVINNELTKALHMVISYCMEIVSKELLC